MLRSCPTSSLFWLLLPRPDCRLLWGIKKKKPNKVLCGADEINMYNPVQVLQVL